MPLRIPDVCKAEAKYCNAMRAECKMAAVQTKFAKSTTILHVCCIVVPQMCTKFASLTHEFACVLQCAGHSLHFAGIWCELSVRYAVVCACWLQTRWECV